MLKKLEIKDFEAHQHNTFHFHPGLNVIHGKSNIGKSAVLRALELAAYGKWAAGENKKKGIQGPVRIGCTACEIEVESDKGKVRVRRGKSINEWNIENYETEESFNLKNPGSGAILQAQNILGLRSTEFADMQIRFNWSDQRDKHFLIDEIEGKSSSPSVIAGILDEVGGLSGCEDLMRELASDKGTYEKTMRSITDQVTEVENELVKFEDLDEKLTQCQEAEDKYNKSIELKNKSYRAAEIYGEIIKLQNTLDRYKNLEKEIERALYVLELIEKVSNYLNFIEKAANLHQKTLNISSLLSENKKESVELEKIDVVTIKEKLSIIEEYYNWSERARQLNEKIVKINKEFSVYSKEKILDIDFLNTRLSEVQERMDYWSYLVRYIKQIKQCQNKIKRADELLKIVQNKKQETEYKYENILNDLDLCPFCGQKISLACKEEILEGV